MQAMTAVAITVLILILILILIVGRNFWLYAQQRAHNRRQTDTIGGTDPQTCWCSPTPTRHSIRPAVPPMTQTTAQDMQAAAAASRGGESGGGNGEND